ncbi:MAG: lysophospholipid acyltransferase family protein [Victivallales bacterium]
MNKKRNPALMNFEYFLFLSVNSLVRIIPLRAGYVLADIFSLIFYLFDTRHRKRIIQHLIHAGVARDEKEASRIAKKNFAHFAKFAVEFAKTNQVVTPENISQYVRFSGSEKSKELFFSPGKSSQVIIVTSHMGNWELAGMIYTIFSGRPLLSVMRPFNNPQISEYINSHRVKLNHSVCAKKGALKSLYVALKNGKSISIVSDQHAGTSEGVETTFFGHPARTHASPAILHLRTGIPILVGATVKEADGFKYNVILSDPIIYKPTEDRGADIRAAAQLYTTEIEKAVAQYPEQWMWAHRRWLDINRNRK